MTSFPLLGVDAFPDGGGRERSDPVPGSFASPTAPADPLHSLSQSIFVGDEVINPHPRFGTLTANIRRYLLGLVQHTSTFLPAARRVVAR